MSGRHIRDLFSERIRANMTYMRNMWNTVVNTTEYELEILQQRFKSSNVSLRKESQRSNKTCP
ncbi:DNA gyrase subunit [Dirofilaria immitis]